MNNILITKAGCCGRVSSFAADIPVEPDVPFSGELIYTGRTVSAGSALHSILPGKNCVGVWAEHVVSQGMFLGL